MRCCLRVASGRMRTGRLPNIERIHERRRPVLFSLRFISNMPVFFMPFCFIVVIFLWVCSVGRADVTLVQQVESLDKTAGKFSPPVEITIFVTGDKMRMDFGEASSIIRRDKKLTYSIFHPDKMYMEMPHTGQVVPGKGPETGWKAGKPLKINKTGHQKKIGEFECQEVEVTQADGTMLETWVTMNSEAVIAMDTFRKWCTDEYGELVGGLGVGSGEGMESLGGFPIQTLLFDSEGRLTMKLVVKKLSCYPLKPELFDPPDGYQLNKFEIPSTSETPPADSGGAEPGPAAAPAEGEAGGGSPAGSDDGTAAPP